MKKFFGENVILGSATAKRLYDGVKNLPIIDYHCHLSPKEIAEDKSFFNVGEMWLSGDHYKWRAMRLFGVDESLITGNASYKQKFLAYASVLPKLCGNALYYWTQLELKQIFGIEKSLNADTAAEIYDECNEKLKNVSVQGLLKKFKVEFIATTDDPIDDLRYHGKVGDTILTPTFRPDKALTLDDGYLVKLGEVSGVKIESVETLIAALEKRLSYFVEKGARLADFGMRTVNGFCDEVAAEEIFQHRKQESTEQLSLLYGYLLKKCTALCKAYDVTVQWHFSPLRNINTKMFESIGADAGFDVIDSPIVAENLARMLDSLAQENNLPKMILYTLNPNAQEVVAAISGAFPNVRLGTAWWYNDTLSGIRANLKASAEYAALGAHLGMLTDSRSFSSYVRHDFFRRILADEVAAYVDRGEYDLAAAKELMQDVCHYNIKRFLNFN
jgi:Glucuronate isomerase